MRLLVLFAAVFATLVATPALAGRTAELCAEAIEDAERRTAWLPGGLLYAIAFTESAYRPAGARVTTPWPWTINSPKGSFYLDSHREAVAKVEELQAMGVRNIDVGCMQINLKYHPDAFRSLDEAFRPASNVGYAVRFLGDLEQATRTLFDAVGRYHSATPGRSQAYARRVFARWDQHGGLHGRASKHGLGEPDSPRLLAAPTAAEEEQEDDGAGHGARWRRVYGATASVSQPTTVLQRSGNGSWLRRDDGRDRTVPRGPGQITFR